jgi:hypothetical protein
MAHIEVNMRVLTPLLIGLSGLSFLGFGIAFLIAPRETLALAGVVTEGAMAATELRAFYGGVEVALGALILACATRPSRWRDGLWLTLACYGAIGATRVVGMALDGSDSFFPCASQPAPKSASRWLPQPCCGNAGHREEKTRAPSLCPRLWGNSGCAARPLAAAGLRPCG